MIEQNMPGAVVVEYRICKQRPLEKGVGDSVWVRHMDHNPLHPKKKVKKTGIWLFTNERQWGIASVIYNFDKLEDIHRRWPDVEFTLAEEGEDKMGKWLRYAVKRLAVKKD